MCVVLQVGQIVARPCLSIHMLLYCYLSLCPVSQRLLIRFWQELGKRQILFIYFILTHTNHSTNFSSSVIFTFVPRGFYQCIKLIDCWIYKMSVISEKCQVLVCQTESQRRSIYSDVYMGKAANPNRWKAGTANHIIYLFIFLLHKIFKQLIDYSNRDKWLIDSLIFAIITARL